MKRTALAVGLTACFGLLAGPVRAEDAVYRRGAKEPVPVNGTILDESAAGIKIKVGKDVQLVPAEDVVEVYYQVGDITDLEFRTPYGKEKGGFDPSKTPAERAQALNEALPLYQALRRRVAASAPARRYIDYRIAMIAVEKAQDGPDKAAAIDALKTYLSANSGGWEVVPATKTLAQLLLDTGDKKGALDAYNDLTDPVKHPDMPKDVQLNMNLLVAKMLLADKNYKDAAAKLNAVLGATTDEKQKAMLQVYLQQTQVAQGNLTGVDAKLKDVIKTSTDDNLRAAAYNTLGDYYQQTKQPDEAFWLYLRVDVLYGQDREEHARALYNLWKLFDSVRGDAQRSKECLEHLKDPSLAGTEYQARALKETENGTKSP